MSTAISSTRFILLAILSRHEILATIDVNLNELEYLAARLNPFECRRLIAALHYTSYELPNNLSGAERNVDDEIPCMRHLLHWNSSPAEGRGKTHEVLAHRLRQINRSDLADWLGRSAFKQLGKDLGRAMREPFEGLGKEETEYPHPITLEPPNTREENDPWWFEVDVVLVALLLGLLATLLTLVCAAICYRIKEYRNGKRYKKLKLEENRNKNEETTNRRISARHIDKSSSDTTNHPYPDSDTDTDFY